MTRGKSGRDFTRPLQFSLYYTSNILRAKKTNIIYNCCKENIRPTNTAFQTFQIFIMCVANIAEYGLRMKYIRFRNIGVFVTVQAKQQN
jgi:hypothetical protein